MRFLDDEADEVEVDREAVEAGDEGDLTTTKARSMVFTFHVNQEIWLDGVNMGPAPVDGVPDPEVLLRSLPAKYLVWGREVAPETGAFHLQGYVQWRSPMSFKSVHNKLKPYKVWLKRAYGNAAANREYCTKSGDFVEVGKRPPDGSVEGGTRWEEAVELARCGRIDEVDAQTLVTCVRSLERIEERHMFLSRKLSILAESRNVWVVGPTRCGKSSILTRLFRTEDVYRKIHNKNWCNYRQQPVVLLDDIDAHGFGKWGLHHLKHWTDFYPFPAERKFGNVFIRPLHFIITSNVSPKDVFEDVPADHLAAVLARFKIINLYDCPGNPAFCGCAVHHRNLYPKASLRRFVLETVDWFRWDSTDNTVNCDYADDDPFFRQPEPVDLMELVGSSAGLRFVDRRPRVDPAVVPGDPVEAPVADPEAETQESMDPAGEAVVALSQLGVVVAVAGQ